VQEGCRERFRDLSVLYRKPRFLKFLRDVELVVLNQIYRLEWLRASDLALGDEI